MDGRGALYDGDFNQTLELPFVDGAPRTLFEFNEQRLSGRTMVTGKPCFASTADAGSGCGGSLVA